MRKQAQHKQQSFRFKDFVELQAIHVQESKTRWEEAEKIKISALITLRTSIEILSLQLTTTMLSLSLSHSLSLGGHLNIHFFGKEGAGDVAIRFLALAAIEIARRRERRLGRRLVGRLARRLLARLQKLMVCRGQNEYARQNGIRVAY